MFVSITEWKLRNQYVPNVLRKFNSCLQLVSNIKQMAVEPIGLRILFYAITGIAFLYRLHEY